ncbi:GspH/FimT family pseudopilin [Tepidimonas sp.]|uniref:GspH/FimT family pseudopilin n=1 Tax=Tepidimonas sp. TaxID=2002775 RepID=UPI00261A05D5|nr:GspH/FimT family pseudopilin [Tepidimonas sp.]
MFRRLFRLFAGQPIPIYTESTYTRAHMRGHIGNSRLKPHALHTGMLQRSVGFTLIELMVTVAILAILLAVGGPALQGFIESSRMRSATHDLYSDLQLARLEAIRRNQRVTVCKANASLTQCNNTGAWHGGWLVFLDTLPGSSPAVENASDILRAHAALNGNIRILGNGGANGTATYASFAPDGTSKQLNGAFMAGTWRVCSTSSALSDDNRARHLILNNSGRIVSQSASGVPATCPAP